MTAQNEAAGRGNESAASPAASALTTIFSPSRAPKRKTMGLLQRSFLDLADQGEQALELAIVVDGTDSMATELEGVRTSIHRMLEDLRQYRKSEVRVALVVYRDAGSPSGDVTLLLDRFTSDSQAIEQAVSQLQPESGAPFFHELTDEGVHAALTQLPWSDDPQVAKWLLLFGDAPPYSTAFSDPDYPEARRRYADSILIGIAKRKNIRINSVLCTSGGNVSESYQKSVDQTRSFMNELCSGTDGLMLDLSYPEIRTAMIDASRQPVAGLTEIPPITAIDLEAVRRQRSGDTSRTRTVSLAVVPHLPLSQISFAANHPAVQVSTAIREKLSRIPGVRIASPRDIKEQVRRLRAEGIQDDQAMRGLAGRLGVDFVIWGTAEPDQATYRTAAYRRDDGEPIVSIALSRHDGDAAYALIEATAQSSGDNETVAMLMRNIQQAQSAVTAPLAETPATTDELLTAMEALEQSLAFEAGSEESVELLATADRASRNARTAEPRNALAHWLQANIAFNQAARLYQRGEKKAARDRVVEMRASLNQALTNRDSLALESLKTEIEADYYLLVARDIPKAIERYQAMIETDQPLETQLRGHWTLAGIYAGDYGLAETPAVDPVKARRHVTEVLANWPESPQAELLKQWLRWDERTEQTQFNYLPQINAGLVGA